MRPIAGADEGLAHAHEQIKRADEQLTRLTEQLAKMERDDARPPAAGPDPKQPDLKELAQGSGAEIRPGGIRRAAICLAPTSPAAAGRPALRRRSSACRWRRASLSRPWFGSRPMAAGPGPVAPQLASTPTIAAGKSAVSAQSPSTVQVAAAEAAPSQAAATPPQATALAQAAPQDAAPPAPAALPDATHVAANDGARPRESGAKPRAAQGEPAANRQRQFKSHRGAQGEPGRDESAQLAKVTEQAPPRTSQPPSPTAAAGSGRAQARANATAGARAASIPEGVDVRRLVADGASAGCNGPDVATRTPLSRCHRKEPRRKMTLRCAIAFCISVALVSSHLPISGSGRSL